MTLPLELGGIRDPQLRRALEIISLQFPVVAAGGGGGGAPSGPAGGVLSGTYPNPGFAADMATQAELDTHTALTTAAHGGIVADTDARLTNARTPTAHATTHQPGGTDAMAVDAAAATGSLRTLGTTATSAAAGNDARLSDARTPSGVIAGDLAGSTWPTLNIAAGVIVNADISATAAIAKTKLASLDVVNADVNAAAAIAESKLNLATDAAAGTGSRRTIGTGALQAAAGNDARLSDSRAPNGAAGGDLAGTYPNPTLAATQTTNARVAVKKTGVTVGTRRGLNLIEGSNVTLTVADDAANEEVDVTIASSAAGSAPAVVTAFPGSPTDGQEVYLETTAMATAGVRWRCVYRSASAKWVFVGGAALFNEVVTEQTTTSITYAALTTAGPSLAVPVAGVYLVEIGFTTFQAAGTTFRMSYDIGATAAVDADAVRGGRVDGGQYGSWARSRVKTLTAVTLTAKYKLNTAVSSGAADRWMSLIPAGLLG